MSLDFEKFKVLKDFKITRIVTLKDIQQEDFFPQEGDILAGNNNLGLKETSPIIGMKFSEYVEQITKGKKNFGYQASGEERIGNRVLEYQLSRLAAVKLEVGSAYRLALSDVNVAGSLSLQGDYAHQLRLWNVYANMLNIGRTDYGIRNQNEAREFSLIGGSESLRMENVHVASSLHINGIVSKSGIDMRKITVDGKSFINFDPEYGVNGADIQGTFNDEVYISGYINGNLELDRSVFKNKVTIGDLVVDGNVSASDVKGLSPNNIEIQGDINVSGSYKGQGDLKTIFKG